MIKVIQQEQNAGVCICAQVCMCLLWLPCFCVVCGHRHLSPGCPSLSSGLSSHTHTVLRCGPRIPQLGDLWCLCELCQCVSLNGVGLDFGLLWGMRYLTDCSVINKVHPSLSLLLSVLVSPSLCICFCLQYGLLPCGDIISKSKGLMIETQVQKDKPFLLITENNFSHFVFSFFFFFILSAFLVRK